MLGRFFLPMLCAALLLAPAARAQDPPGGMDVVNSLLEVRCKVAICFHNGDKLNWMGIEPLVELPIGKSFAFGTGSLANYVNNNDIRVDLAAGLRVWLFQDFISASVYLSKPLTDASVRVTGSSFVYPASALKRPFPGVALGLLFDTLWVSMDKDELRNGNTEDSTAYNPGYGPNALVSSTWTFTVALQPVTSFRTAVGLVKKVADTAKESDGTDGREENR